MKAARRDRVDGILKSRFALRPDRPALQASHDDTAEGGCGVIGIACSDQIEGRHLLASLEQMRNRGNGKGGGIAAAGLVPEQFGVSRDVLENDYLLAVGYLDRGSRAEVEATHIETLFQVDHVHTLLSASEGGEAAELDVQPPDVVIYFCRVRPEAVDAFVSENELHSTDAEIEDEIVYQNSVRLNQSYYASEGESKAFVLSHGKNLLVAKMVGYGGDVIRHYQLEDLRAHIWIGHHRYPTTGRVWHPGGAHPFIGMNEALVHNGDFANYVSIRDYLAQKNVFPLFLTDTEVSVQVFDLLRRTYRYPLEYVIESMAPTTERDFALLPVDKQLVYEMLQRTHIHASPDGPWFFLLAQSEREKDKPVYRLTGITDTSMLRPQVFAWQQSDDSGPTIGLAASEKQAIDAALASLSSADHRFWSQADRYWNARGGSHTDGGAFIFTVGEDGIGRKKLRCTNKFGVELDFNLYRPSPRAIRSLAGQHILPSTDAAELQRYALERMNLWDYAELRSFLNALEELTELEQGWRVALDVITGLLDRRTPVLAMRRSAIVALLHESLGRLLQRMKMSEDSGFVMVDDPDRQLPSEATGQTMVIDALGFAPEGPRSVSRLLAASSATGFSNFAIVNTRGDRFIGSGLGPDSGGIRIDVYGSPGDYLGSGIDGAEIYVHASGQDQLGQIQRGGKLVVYGDVGQTFMYGAKGGEAYVLGNAAGRPLINGVGRPRVVINGTCLDYLAESFMAGDPLDGGGFAILNGIVAGDYGQIEELESPYPGGNLFSLASGGALYIRDPRRQIGDDQLNGGVIESLTDADWQLILPYLQENQRLFNIPIRRLLEIDGLEHSPQEVYRKIRPSKTRALQAEEAWIRRGRKFNGKNRS